MEEGAAKKRKGTALLLPGLPSRPVVLPHEEVYLGALPCAPLYERSYMHREPVTAVAASRLGRLVTASADGFVKFWKPAAGGALDFVKTFRAHGGPVAQLAVSPDGAYLVSTCAADRTLKVFDVLGYDMVNLARLAFEPGAVCWSPQHRIFCADAATGDIHAFDTIELGQAPRRVLAGGPPGCLLACSADRLVVARAGGIRLYDAATLADVTPDEPHLAAAARVRTLRLSDDGRFFVTTADDRQVRVHRAATGRLYRQYDESLDMYRGLQAAGRLPAGLGDADFARRLAAERELEGAPGDALFDESGHFLLLSSAVGIKVLNLATNRVSAYLGAQEGARFLALALLQPAGQRSFEMAASENPAAAREAGGPVLLATAHGRSRFYMFTRQEPDRDRLADRDVLNERPAKDDAGARPAAAKALPVQAILRTTVGDIVLRLLPDAAPLAVENFVTHARNGYYDNLLFHRCIKGFMVQTGDPLGDGTGGESIWGADFRDEIRPDVLHDVPFTVSMANAGPNTNGSQFFVTTVKCPWLDGKHTVFGRVVRGSDVVSKIEQTESDELDRPLKDVKILQIDIVQ